MAEPIVEQIAQAIETKLRGITTARGYHYTLSVQWNDPDGASLGNLKAIVAQDEPVMRDAPPVGYVEWDQPFAVAVGWIAASGESPQTTRAAMNRIYADVYSVLAADRTLGGLAIDCTIPAPLFFENAVVAVVNVYYRHRENDPYSLT